jgi:hypothetical protein
MLLHRVDAITFADPVILGASAAKRAKWIRDAEAMPVAAPNVGLSIKQRTACRVC